MGGSGSHLGLAALGHSPVTAWGEVTSHLSKNAGGESSGFAGRQVQLLMLLSPY